MGTRGRAAAGVCGGGIDGNLGNDGEGIAQVDGHLVGRNAGGLSVGSYGRNGQSSLIAHAGEQRRSVGEAPTCAEVVLHESARVGLGLHLGGDIGRESRVAEGERGRVCMDVHLAGVAEQRVSHGGRTCVGVGFEHGKEAALCRCLERDACAKGEQGQ